MMNPAETLPAPEINLDQSISDPWQQNRAAFLRMRTSLSGEHTGRYVAIHQEQVVSYGEDKISVALEAYGILGRVPVYVGLVGDAEPDPVRMPTLRKPAASQVD